VVRVSGGTLDELIRHQREELGPEQAGRELFALLLRITSVPEWWELAYTLDGQLVGLHMPTTMPKFATIGYIGVLPEYRGQGYIDDLLAQATRTLAQAQAERIEADTDIANAPMANAFLRAGYVQFATRRELRLRL
jgi:RimJ/RimL family protein N-acetyltransferase